jgi:hypothetical protein
MKICTYSLSASKPDVATISAEEFSTVDNEDVSVAEYK